MATLVTIPLIALMIADSTSLKPGDHTRSIEVDKQARTYLVHIPKSYGGSKPIPLILAFHGGASDAAQMVHFSGLNEKSESAGFVVVYPNGTGIRERVLTWNGGNCCGYAMLNNVDDVAFTRELLDDLEKLVRIDRKRVYATGMSNGAIMAYRLASELSERIAAIAPVAGPMGTETCTPKRPVSVIHFHGTDDEFAPFNGGKGKRSVSGTNFYSVEHSIRAWVKANGCPEEPVFSNFTNEAQDGTTVARTVYGPGKDGAEVFLVTIKGGGHTWPGRTPRLYFLGKSTKNISANDLMWEFFEKHPMK
jgi:polyhydroxybutyrate depolymerase